MSHVIVEALQRVTQHAVDKGYDHVSVALVVNLAHTRPYGFSIDLLPYSDPNRRSKWGHGTTLDEAIDDAINALDSLPRAWTDADVAATLGIVA